MWERGLNGYKTTSFVCPWSIFISRYREYAEFQLATDGEGIGLRVARQDLAANNISLPEMFDLDELVIESVQVADYVNPLLLDNQAIRSLAEWW